MEENGGRCRKTSNTNLKALICKYAFVYAKHITTYKNAIQPGCRMIYIRNQKTNLRFDSIEFCGNKFIYNLPKTACYSLK